MSLASSNNQAHHSVLPVDKWINTFYNKYYAYSTDEAFVQYFLENLVEIDSVQRIIYK